MADEEKKTVVELQEGAQTKQAAPQVQASTNLPPIQQTPPQTVVDRPTDKRPAWRKGVDNYFATESDSDEKPAYGNYQDVFDYLEARKAEKKLPTKEQLEKERRRRKTDSIIAGITDGVSALANLFFTTKYAPSLSFKPENSMSAKVKERYDKLKEKHEKDAEDYYNYAMTIAKLKQGLEDKEYQKGRDKLQDQIRMSQEARAQLKADLDAGMADLKQQYWEGKITEQEYAAEEQRIKAEYADRFWNSKIEENESKKRKNDRWQPSSGRSSGGGGGTKYKGSWLDKDGVTVHYSPTEQIAITEAAANGGTYLGKASVSETTKPDKWGILRLRRRGERPAEQQHLK